LLVKKMHQIIHSQALHKNAAHAQSLVDLYLILG